MTHKRLLVAVVLLAASGVLAQTANVIELSPVDAARAQKAWDTLQRAQAEWKETQKDMEVKYVPLGAKGHCTIATDGRCLSDEWINGFEFSKDFKAIVPKTWTQTWTAGGNTILTPAYPTYPCWGWTTPTCVGTGCTFKYQ
jgi:hypothetical protein